jgi:lysophospholipase L1-like esterase
VGVVVPEVELGERASIEVFAATTSTGAPLGGDRITLTRKFFYLAALGDSAMWGNGLEESSKFTSLVARRIEQELGGQVVRNVRAVSGANIVIDSSDGVCSRRCGDGEVPEVFTSVTTQAETLEQPELYDLILLDGCGNDVGLEHILSSTDNTELISERVELYCRDEMARLLLRVRALAPQAPIVVTGYFPFVSGESDLSAITTWAAALGIDLGTEEDIADATRNFVVNSEVFVRESTAALRAAVEAVDGLENDDPPIVFVNPGFGADNATFAPQAWLWGLTQNIPLANQLRISLLMFPEDPLLDERVGRCGRGGVAPSLLACIYGALGHPNRAGAQAYANGIVAALREIELLPPAGAASP